MLSALGLGGPKKRWAPAGKLQKDGKMSKKALMEYLEFGAIQLASVDSMEAIARAAKDKPDESKYVDMFNDWQCQLIEHRGYDVNFGRMSLDEWKQTAGTPGTAKTDPKIVDGFATFERAIQVTLSCALQLREIRDALQLGDNGVDDGDALMPRRADKAEKLQTVGPVQKQKLIKFCELARDLVLSRETMELIEKLLSDYSTWKQEQLLELVNKNILHWQFELWDSTAIAIDHRLGMVELMRAMPLKTDVDFLTAQQNMFHACQAITMWFSMKVHKDAVPRVEGRRYEPWSLADKAFKEERAGALVSDGIIEIQQFRKIMQKVVDTLGSDEHGRIVEEVAFATEPADLRAPERLNLELYEACGLEYRFSNAMVVYCSSDEEVQKLAQQMGEAQKALKARMMGGLRKLMEAKKAAAEEKSEGK